jgi:translocation and assembly module TamA
MAMRGIFSKFFVACLFWLFAAAFASEPTLHARIQGISDAPVSLNAQLRVQQNIDDLPKPLTASQIENFYLYSDDDIKEGVAPFGYFNAGVQKQLLAQPKAAWQINYHVQLNAPTRISAIHLSVKGEGGSAPRIQQIIHACPLHVGQFFLSRVYDDYKAQLLSAAQESGYVQAAFVQHVVWVDRRKNQAVVVLQLNTGPRYYFGVVHFAHNPLSDDFLRRFILFKPRQAFSNDQANQLQTHLKNSGYFAQVVVTPQFAAASAQHVVPIEVSLKPVAKQQYIFGLGYGTDTGPRATLGSDWHYLNAYGHRLNTLLRLSAVQNTASVQYTIPGNHPLTDAYNIHASVQNNNISQGNSVLAQVGLGYRYMHDRWQYDFSLSAQRERYNFFNDPYQTSHLLLPGFTIDNVLRNDPVRPTAGHHFNFRLIAARQGFLSDTNLVQVVVSEKWLYAFDLNNMILLRGNIGLTAIHDRTSLPLSLNFFAGGAQSVRGYGYNNLGPGRYLVVGSAEYRYRVHDNWFAALFFDIGNAFNNWPTAPHSGLRSNVGAVYHLLHQGAGVGVVWLSPVGAMALSYAQEVDVPGRPSRIQFNLGADL